MDGGLRFAAMLPDIPAVVAPVLRIAPVAHDSQALRVAQGLVFTSVHALTAAGAGQGRFAICVGSQTAGVARAAGFDVVEGQGTADSILPLIAKATVPLIHPHGRHVAKILPVPGMVVYDQQPVVLTARAQVLLAGKIPVILPVFSPRSASLLSQQVKNAQAGLWVVAISDAALRAWTGPARRVIVAQRPDADAMKTAILQLVASEQS
jgi:uroporphyrinogen-III synthase